MRLAVLVSGSGTLLDAILTADLPVALVIADRPCRGLEIAREAGVHAELVPRAEFGAEFDREAYALSVVECLSSHQVDVVAMAGFGTVLGASMFEFFTGRVINTHPALLPAFPGWHAVRDALAYGVKVTGCTIHVATSKVDDGPILAQEAVEVLDGDDEARLHERIKSVERRLYVETLVAVVERGHVLGAR